MKIAVLCGSARPAANSLAYAEAFREGAVSAGHEAEIINIGTMNITGCRGCEYCHGAGAGTCAQRDDMDKVWEKLEGAEMAVLASPVYYWGFSGQMQNVITRFYSKGMPAAQRYVLILSSGSPGVYDSILSQFDSIMNYSGRKCEKVLAFSGMDQPEPYLEEVRSFAASL